MSIDKTAIRNAATVIVIRDRMTTPSILMGQRGSKAAFMPNKFVFPGGAVDAADAHVPLGNAPQGSPKTQIQPLPAPFPSPPFVSFGKRPA